MSRIRIAGRAGNRTQGWLIAGPTAIPVALGRAGIKANKREGDGGTPRGCFRPVRLWWRADRATRPATGLPTRPITALDAWSENPKDRRYNKHFLLADGHPGDRLRRQDHIYDYVVELDHNTRPRIAGRGSAVFIHIARPGFKPTAGCVALAAPRLRWLLSRLGRQTRILIQ